MPAKLFTLLTFVLYSTAGLAQTTSIVIKAPLLYDAEGNRFLESQQILIEGDKIKAIGPHVEAPGNARVITLTTATVTPGLIDAHTHLLTVQHLPDNLAADALLNSSERRVLRAAGFARDYLLAGFTSIRDLGNSGYYLDMEVASAINRGYIEGPRMFCSGPILSAMDGQFYQLPYATRQSVTEKEYRVIKGPEDAVQAVKEHVNNSVDVIKIVAFGERMGLSTAEMKAIVNTAHDHGLKVTAHSTGGKSLADAIDAGVDGIEHAYYLHDTLLAKMAKKGIYMVPTDPSFNNIIQTQESMHQTKHDTTAIRSELKPLSDRLMRARKAGVMIVAGSDAYFDLPISRGDAAKGTIAAYVEEGLSVEEALQTATINAAKAIGQKDQLGVIKVGAKADIVIFNGNLKTGFSTALFDVKMVIKGGKVIYSKN